MYYLRYLCLFAHSGVQHILCWVFALFVFVLCTLFSPCHRHFPVLSSFMTYQRVCNQINTTGANSGAGTVYPSGASEGVNPIFSGVRVSRSLVLCVCFVDRCLSFCTFSFAHCVVCSSLYGFWLPLWYLQTPLASFSGLFVFDCPFGIL
jgi:hypothetical protein